MKENIKILYIHGFHVIGESKKQKMIEKIVGKKNLITVNMNQRHIICSFILFLLFILSVMLFNIYVSYCFSDMIYFFITLVLSIIIIILIYFIGSRLTLYYIMKKSIKQAEQKIQMYNPDIVIGIYFGAVVAMNLSYKNGKKSLVLISPSIKTFQKFTHNLEPDLSAFPYVIIVNGSKDSLSSMNACEKLISTVSSGKGRLEVVEDNHSYSKLKESDFKTWIKEAIYRPSSCIVNVAKHLKNEKNGKNVNGNIKRFIESSSFENDLYNEDDPLV